MKVLYSINLDWACLKLFLSVMKPGKLGYQLHGFALGKWLTYVVVSCVSINNMLLAVNEHIFIQRPLLKTLKENEKNMQKLLVR